jgi:hypothetical protein
MLASSDEEVTSTIFLRARAKDSVEWRSPQKRFRRKKVKDESIGSINKLSLHRPASDPIATHACQGKHACMHVSCMHRSACKNKTNDLFLFIIRATSTALASLNHIYLFINSYPFSLLLATGATYINNNIYLILDGNFHRCCK